MSYVERKRRIQFDQRGCYFKYKGHEIKLPEKMLEKKALLKKLITSWDKIPDFRKQLKNQQVDKKESNDFGDDGRGDISVIKFKQHEKQFLKTLQKELEGKTLPQIIQKIRSLRETEKNNRDAPIFEINKFFAQHDGDPTEEQIIEFMNRKKGSKEFEKKGNVVVDAEEDFVQMFRKKDNVMEDDDLSIKSAGSQIEEIENIDQEKFSFSEQLAAIKQKMKLDEVGDEESKSQTQIKMQPSVQAEFGDDSVTKKSDQMMVQIRQKKVDPMPTPEQIEQNPSIGLRYGEYIKYEIQNLFSLVQGKDQGKSYSDFLKETKNFKKTKEDKGEIVSFVVPLPQAEFTPQTKTISRYWRNIFWMQNFMKQRKNIFLENQKDQDFAKKNYDTDLLKAKSLYEITNQIYKDKNFYKQPTTKEQTGKGEGRGNSQHDGQSGDFLNKIMREILSKKKYKIHEKDFLGVFQQHDSQLENKLMKIPKDQKIVFWIQNTNDFDSKEDVKDDYHWYAVFLDLHHMNFNIFDSSGIVDAEQMSQVKKYIQILQPEYLMKIKRNYNDIQGSTSLCGYYSMLFLIRMMNSDGNFAFSSMRDLSKKQGRKIVDKVFTTM